MSVLSESLLFSSLSVQIAMIQFHLLSTIEVQLFFEFIILPHLTRQYCWVSYYVVLVFGFSMKNTIVIASLKA